MTVTQRQVAVGLLTGGHRLDVVIGIAGSGKTTTLTAVRAGFETAGYHVVGTPPPVRAAARGVHWVALRRIGAAGAAC